MRHLNGFLYCTMLNTESVFIKNFFLSSHFTLTIKYWDWICHSELFHLVKGNLYSFYLDFNFPLLVTRYK